MGRGRRKRAIGLMISVMNMVGILLFHQCMGANTSDSDNQRGLSDVGISVCWIEGGCLALISVSLQASPVSNA